MRVLTSESENEALRIFIRRKSGENGCLFEFFYRYIKKGGGKTCTFISEKEYSRSIRNGFRLVMQDVLALLSRERSRLNLSEIENFYGAVSITV